MPQFIMNPLFFLSLIFIIIILFLASNRTNPVLYFIVLLSKVTNYGFSGIPLLVTSFYFGYYNNYSVTSVESLNIYKDCL